MSSTGAWEDFGAQYVEATRRNRDLVLRHPDIAQRLTQHPLNYGRPDQWTGYIPAYEWGGQVNDSIRRTALLDIVMAAEEADKQAPVAPENEDVEVF
jgi:hypothetical protein